MIIIIMIKIGGIMITIVVVVLWQKPDAACAN
jgi:hypothetical protein